MTPDEASGPSLDRPPLDADRLRSFAADGGTLWNRIDIVPEVGSTNALATQHARDGDGEGLVVVTEHQTQGRGRLDRSWETPPRAALTLSLLLRPDRVPVERWPWLPLLTGYAVFDALARVTSVDAGLKWPNDVLIGDRKVAGILVERIETPTGAAAVVGIGLNVSTTAAELPVPNATSLAIEAGDAPDRTDVLLELLTSFDRAYAAWLGEGGDPARLRTDYTSACVTLGQNVRVELPAGDPVFGEAVGIDESGRLLVATGAGVSQVGAGDVVHVRQLDQ